MTTPESVYALAGHCSFRNTSTRDSAATTLRNEAAARGLWPEVQLGYGAGIVNMVIEGRPGFSVCFAGSYPAVSKAAADLEPYLQSNQYEGNFGLYQVR